MKLLIRRYGYTLPREAFTVTNYEMSHLRTLAKQTETRWWHVWSSVSEPFHPKSREEWERHDDQAQ